MATDKSSDTRLTALFLDMLAAEQGAGVNTLDAYRGDLEDLSDFIARRKSTFQKADTQMLRDYLGDLDDRGFKSSSVARKLSSTRHLFRFLLVSACARTIRPRSSPARNADAHCRRSCPSRMSTAS